MKPDEPSFIVAGANGYCSLPEINTGWQELFASSDGGRSWANSLVPGYLGDTSAEGQASPLSGDLVASDPVLDWDTKGHLFYGLISLNPGKPANGNTSVATFTRDPSSPLGIDYNRTVIVGAGTPSSKLGTGHFNDKPSIKVDDWQSSPYRDNVYYAWGLFTGTGGVHDALLFSRSTDGGKTFSHPMKVTSGSSLEVFTDVAVGPDGAVYIFWRQFFVPFNAIGFVKSTDGGETFSKPTIIRAISPYEPRDRPIAEDPDPRDCGDGPELCQSGFVFHRTLGGPQATVDAAGKVYVAYDRVTPVPSNGDTYTPDGQGHAVVIKSSDGGRHWSDPVIVDPQPVGHQWAANPEYDKVGRKVALIYYDSRSDPAYSPNRPIGNTAAASSPCGTPVGSRTCNLVNTYIATSSDGIRWSARKVSSVGHQPQYEVVNSRSVPFVGDYISVDTAGGTVFGVWTDNRDVVPGIDPREEIQDGFDVLQCRSDPTAPDTCANAGGLNQNIYGAALP